MLLVSSFKACSSNLRAAASSFMATAISRMIRLISTRMRSNSTFRFSCSSFNSSLTDSSIPWDKAGAGAPEKRQDRIKNKMTRRNFFMMGLHRVN